MIKLAGGSVFLGIAALVGTLFYFQPKVEAKTNFTENYAQENLTQTNIQPENQSINQNQQELQTQKSSENNIEKLELETESEFASEAKHYRATAYCLRGRTASGGSVRRGIVAADRRVLPLGSRIRINAGSYSGTYLVTDTGGAIRGNILDIWVPSCAEAMRFGRRSIKVSVLGKKRNS